MPKKLEIRVPAPKHKSPGDTVKVRVDSDHVVLVTIPERDSDSWTTTPEERENGNEFFKVTVLVDQLEEKPINPSSPSRHNSKPTTPVAQTMSNDANEADSSQRSEDQTLPMKDEQLQEEPEELVKPNISLGESNTIQSPEGPLAGDTQESGFESSGGGAVVVDLKEPASKPRKNMFSMFTKQKSQNSDPPQSDSAESHVTESAATLPNSPSRGESGAQEHLLGSRTHSQVQHILQEHAAAAIGGAVNHLQNQEEVFQRHYQTLIEIQFALKVSVACTVVSTIMLVWWGFLAGILLAVGTYVLLPQIKSAMESKSVAELDLRLMIDLCIASTFFAFLIGFFGFFLPPAAFLFSTPNIPAGSIMFVSIWSAAGGAASLVQFGLSLFVLHKIQGVAKDTPYKWTLCAPFARAQTRLEAEKENEELRNDFAVALQNAVDSIFQQQQVQLA